MALALLLCSFDAMRIISSLTKPLAISFHIAVRNASSKPRIRTAITFRYLTSSYLPCTPIHKNVQTIAARLATKNRSAVDCLNHYIQMSGMEGEFVTMCESATVGGVQVLAFCLSQPTLVSFGQPITSVRTVPSDILFTS